MRYDKYQISYIFMLLIVIINISCNLQKRKSFIEMFEQAPPIIIQKEEKLVEQLDPTAIYLMNDVLFLHSRGTDNNLFSIIDTSNFKEIVRFGVQGRGPMEIGLCGFISKINPDSILILDVTDYEVYLYSIKNIIKGNLLPSKVFRTKKNSNDYVKCNSLNMIGIKNDEIIGTGIFSEGRYALFDSMGLVKDYYVKYPEFKGSAADENPFICAMAYQAFLCKQPKGRLLAGLDYGIMDIIEYYPDKGIQLKYRNEYIKNEMRAEGNFNVDGVSYPSVSHSRKSVVGFDLRHFQGTNKFIYCLYSSLSFEEIGFHAKLKFKDLLTFNWKGKPQYHYTIDREVYGFSVSDDNKTVYFLSYDDNDEPTIIKAKL